MPVLRDPVVVASRLAAAMVAWTLASVAAPVQAVDLTAGQAQIHAQAATALCNLKQPGTVWAEFDGMQCQCMGRRFAARLPAAQPDVLQPDSPARLKALAFAARGCRNPFGVRQALAPGFLPGEPLAGTTLMSRPAASSGPGSEPPPPAKPAPGRPTWKAPDMQLELLTSHCAALAPGGVEAVRERCGCFARGYLAANPPGSTSVAAVDLLAFKAAVADPATFQRLGGPCLSRAAAGLTSSR